MAKKKTKKVKKPKVRKYLELKIFKVQPHDRYFLQAMSPIKHARAIVASARKDALRELDEIATRFRELNQQDNMLEQLDQLRAGDGAWVLPDRELLLDANWYIVRETHYDDKAKKSVMTSNIRIARWRDDGGWEGQGMAPTHSGLVMFIPNPKVKLDDLEDSQSQG